MKVLILGPIDPDDGQLYWSNEDGWVVREDAAIFDKHEVVCLPVEAEGLEEVAVIYRTTVDITRATYYEIEFSDNDLAEGETPEDFVNRWNPDDGERYIHSEFSDTLDWVDGAIEKLTEVH